MRLIILCIAVCFFVQPVFGQISSREYFKLGKSKFDEGNYYDAIDFLDQAIVTDSLYESALFLRGEAFLELEKYSLAVRDFDRIISQRKSFDTYAAEYFLKRGVAYTEMHAFDKAESDLSRAIQLDAGNAEIYFETARLKNITMSDKNYAIRELDKAIQHDPDNARYYKRRAEYKIEKAKFEFNSEEMYESALRDISFAITLDPKNFDYYLLRSEINKQRGHPREALADYNKMIEIDPYRIEAYSERGILKMQSDQYESAINDFTSAIERNSAEEKNYRFRALCRYNLRDYNGAYEDYSISIEVLSNEMRSRAGDEQIEIRRILADTYIKRGAAATSMGNSFNACADFRMAYQLGSRLGLNYLRKYCGI